MDNEYCATLEKRVVDLEKQVVALGRACDAACKLLAVETEQLEHTVAELDDKCFDACMLLADAIDEIVDSK